MKNPPRISIIATTYNQSRDLDLYLRCLQRQSIRDFEIIIADDGSREDTKAIIDAHRRAYFGDRLKHVWHEDIGYRKCKILNSAIKESSGEWLVFTDTDLIVHPRFVEDHASMAQPNSMFMGRRVDLGKAVSEWIRQNPSQLFSLGFYAKVLASGLVGSRETRNVRRAFRIANPILAKVTRSTNVPDLLGSNFSIDRELLYRVNGFDENSVHYWGEDGDLFIRVRNSGAAITGRKCFAVQFHLWHKTRSPQLGAEETYKHNVTQATHVRCENGLVTGPSGQ